MTFISGTDQFLLSLPTTGAGTFTIATTPTQSTATLVPLAPNWTSGPTTVNRLGTTVRLCPYRPRFRTVLDGLVYYANGRDQAFRWDPANPSSYYDLGAAAATGFTIADAAAGTTFPAGTVLDYKLVFYNEAIGKETAPQTSTVSDETVTFVRYTMAGTKDAKIDWTDPGGEFTKVKIYRRLQSTNTFHFVAEVAAATATYTDSLADSAIRADPVIQERYRTTLPPIAAGIGAHLNKLWIWEKGGTTLYHSQYADPLGALLQEDFPPGNFVQVNPEDACGELRAFYAHDKSAWAFKERACYEIEGDDSDLFAPRRIYRDRGALSPNCVTAKDDILYILDERGLYACVPGGQPQMLGLREKQTQSPMQPIWDRMNLGAASFFTVRYDHRAQLIIATIAIDYEPVPNIRVVYDIGNNRYIGYDTLVWPTADGWLEDAFGGLHDVFADDRGVLWEQNYAESEGVFAGDNTKALTSATVFVLTASAAAFDTNLVDGTLGVPLRRYTSAGAVADENRVEAASSTALTTYYFAPTAYASGDSVAIGVIPWVVALPKLWFSSPRKKEIGDVEILYETESAGRLKIETSRNEGSFAQKLDRSGAEFSLTSGDRKLWPIYDNGCYLWQLQLSQDYANWGVSIRSITIFVNFGNFR